MLPKLVYESGIASKYNLKGSTFTVLIALSCHWNTTRNDAFPSQQTMAKNTNLSERSVKNGLKDLKELGFIISSRNLYGNVYKFTQKFFEEVSNLDTKSSLATGKICPTKVQNLPLHENKEINNNNITSYTDVVKNEPLKNDDVSLKTSNNIESISEYKDVIAKLKRWNVYDAYKLMKCKGLAKIKQCIELTENKKPKNAGGYFRSLLNLKVLSSTNTSMKNDLGTKPSEGNLIVQQNNCSVMPNNSLEHCKKIQQINEPKPSRQEMIQNLINEGKTKEANELKKLWRIVS